MDDLERGFNELETFVLKLDDKDRCSEKLAWVGHPRENCRELPK